MILVAVIYIPFKLGGYDVIFHGANTALSAKGSSTLLNGSQYLGFSTLALGSALALFLYPHAVTGVLAARSRDITPSKTATHFGSASFAFSAWGINTKMTIWTVGVVANLVVATALTPLLARLPRGRDETSPGDYVEAEAPPIPIGPGPAVGEA